MRAHDDLLVGEVAKEVGGEQVAGKLGLTHTWGDVDDDAFLFAINHILKYLGQLPVVRPDLESGIDVLGKLNHVGSPNHQLVALFALLQHFHEFDLFSQAHGGEGTLNCLNFCRV